MLDAMAEHWERAGRSERLHLERFQPVIGGADAEGEGGTISFVNSGCETRRATAARRSSSPARRRASSCRTAAAWASATPASARFRSGRVRDLRSGEVSDAEGEMCRTCVNAPEGPVEIEL